MYEIADKAGSLSSGRIAILAALNIADEMFKERQHVKELADELAQRLEQAIDPQEQSPDGEEPS